MGTAGHRLAADGPHGSGGKAGYPAPTKERASISGEELFKLVLSSQSSQQNGTQKSSGKGGRPRSLERGEI